MARPPYGSPDDHWPTTWSARGLAGTVLYPLVRYLIPPKVSVVAAKVAEVAPNSGKVFLFGGKPAILVWTPEGTSRPSPRAWGSRAAPPTWAWPPWMRSRSGDGASWWRSW